MLSNKARDLNVGGPAGFAAAGFATLLTLDISGLLDSVTPFSFSFSLCFAPALLSRNEN